MINSKVLHWTKWGPFFQLVMLTGDRRSEWSNARKECIVANGARLEIPAASDKTGKVQIMPLSRQAQTIVSTLPSQGLGQFILSSTGDERPISGFSKARTKLDALVLAERGKALDDWVVRDLRRSMATHMERLGVARHIIEVSLRRFRLGFGRNFVWWNEVLGAAWNPSV